MCTYLKRLNSIKPLRTYHFEVRHPSDNMGKAQLKKHLPLMEYLVKGKPKIKKAIIEESDAEVMKVFCECAKNTLNGNVQLSPAQYKKLQRYKSHLRQLADKKVGVRKKKAILQKGGFLGALLGAVLPTLATAVGSIFGAQQ